MIADSRWFVECDNCDYDFTLHVSSTRDYSVKVYDFGNRTLLPLISLRCWCQDCNTVEWVERIPSESEIQNELIRYKKVVDEFTSGKSNWPGKPLVEHYQSVMRNQSVWFQWARGRDSGRCLKCGCQRIETLEQSILNNGGGDLGIEHPGCGGTLYARVEELDCHASVSRWDYDEPINFSKFTPDGFPIANLRKQADDDFPEFASLLFAVVASEAKAVLSSGRRKRQGSPVRDEDEFPEICEETRAFVRKEIAGGILPRYEEGNLSYEFPQLYGMFCQEARRMISNARAEQKVAGPAIIQKSKLARNKSNSLHKNPFAVLGATVRDDRRKIVELAEEKSLSVDSDECNRARSDLTTPSKRLRAEVGWMPGLSPKQAEKMVSALESDIDSVRGEVSLPSMASANLLAAAIEMLDPSMDTNLWCEWIEDLAHAAQEIDAEEVLRDVNEDRSVAGFPPIQGLDLVEVEITDRKKAFSEVVRNAFEDFDSDKMVKVVTKLVDDATLSGEVHAPQVIHDIVDRYEIEALRFLEPEAGNIRKIVEVVKESAPKGERTVSPLIEKLDAMLRNWDFVAQPIQLSAKAQGLGHELSNDLAWTVRGLAVEMFNKHNMLDSSRKLAATLKDLFAELPDIVEKLEDDVATLGEISERRAESEQHNAEWARQITYKAEVGVMFKDELSVSPEGLSWKGTRYPLEAITRVRWGGVRNSVNGIPTGTDYTIGFGDNKSAVAVSLRREATYSKFLECMWRAVCVRLLYEIGEELKGGRKFTFGEIEVEDDAVTLIKHKMLGMNERMRLGWHDVSVWSANGAFVIGRKGDTKTYGTVSYIESWNTHVLEHIVRGGFKQGVRRLSDYFKE